ncbi:MAG: prolipoprotein diacylglyceryl transferase [Candidatus Omnitrophica bacterium]|nr:prolipoprotein diacylglyceryl transferase [Candidatus Omnitrophota bacterium]
MHRYLLKVGQLTVYSYGAMLALAFICGAFFSVRRARQQGLDANKILDLIFVILIFSVAGARIFFVALNWDYYGKNLLEVLKVWEGGLVFYGGLIAGLAATALFLKKHRISFGIAADTLSPGLAIGIAVGRVGCFLNGCCWGKISYRFGVCFPAKDAPGPFAQQVYDGLISPAAGWSLPVLPTQLYESVACLAIFFVLILIEKRKTFDGFLFWSFVALYSIARFFIEGLRYYEPNFFMGKLTVSQGVSLVLFVLALCVLTAGSLRKRSIPRKS